MVLSIIFIVSFIIFSILINYKNRITWIFPMYFIGIGILLFASILYIAKLSNYHYSMSIDYYLYLLLSDIKLTLSDISRIFNFGIAIIMFASLFFFITIKKLKFWVKILMLLPIPIYLWANDPITYYNAFIHINSFDENANKQLISYLLELNNRFSSSILIIYMILPFYAMYLYSKNTKIRLKVKYSLITCICLAIGDIFIIGFFVVGPFSKFMTSNVDLLKFPRNYTGWNYYIILEPIVIFIILILLYLTFYYRPFDTLTVITQKDMNRNSQLLNKNLRMIFHVYKNYFFAIDRLSKQGVDMINKNNNITISNLLEINKLSQDSIQTIARMLDMLSEIKLASQNTNIIECINDALDKTPIPNNVRVIKNFEFDEIYVCADAFHLTECFINLFYNSLDAIALKHNNDAFIKVDIVCEEDMVSINLTDNGCGISNKDIKNIFKVLYSTKQSSKNWGVGLNYVDKVIKLYRGNIFVKSKKAEYTCFQITLPLLSEKEMKKDEKNQISYV